MGICRWATRKMPSTVIPRSAGLCFAVWESDCAKRKHPAAAPTEVVDEKAKLARLEIAPALWIKWNAERLVAIVIVTGAAIMIVTGVAIMIVVEVFVAVLWPEVPQARCVVRHDVVSFGHTRIHPHA